MKPLFLILLIIPFANSCKKKVTDVDGNFVGLWRTQLFTNEAELIISADGKGKFKSWYNQSDAQGLKMQGVARIKDNKLKIGSFDIPLTIIEFPHLIDTTQLHWNRSGPKPNWKIVLLPNQLYSNNKRIELYTFK